MRHHRLGPLACLLASALVACSSDSNDAPLAADTLSPDVAAEPEADVANGDSGTTDAAGDDAGSSDDVLPLGDVETPEDLLQSDDGTSAQPDTSDVDGVQELPDLDDVSANDAGPADVGEPPPQIDLGGVPLAVQSFDRGPRVGDPTPDGALVVARYTGDAPELRLLVVSAEGSLVNPVSLYQEAPVVVGEGGWLRVELTGLSPATTYRALLVAYNTEGVALGLSAPARFKTAPAADALVDVRFGGASCSKQDYKPFKTLEQAAGEALDFFILGGDTTYADGATDVAGYRAKWDEAMLDAGYRALALSTSFIATWDDHEVGNNWDPEKISAEQLQAATQVFFEQLPVRPQNGPTTIWRRLRWGKTLDLFVLDCRSERKPSTLFSASPQYISPEQMAWLKDGLSESDAVFKLVINSVPITEMPLLFVTSWDRWQGYAAQRTELLDYISAKKIPNVVWLAGDFHFPATTHVGPPNTPAFAMREVLMGPVGHIPNPLWLTVAADSKLSAQFPFVDGTLNYTRFEAKPLADPPTLSVEFVDGDGAVFHSEVFEGVKVP